VYFLYTVCTYCVPYTVFSLYTVCCILSGWTNNQESEDPGSARTIFRNLFSRINYPGLGAHCAQTRTCRRTVCKKVFFLSFSSPIWLQFFLSSFLPSFISLFLLSFFPFYLPLFLPLYFPLFLFLLTATRTAKKGSIFLEYFRTL
jgi:hypothetical protein